MNPGPAERRPASPALLALAVFALLAGLRFALLDRFGGSVPYWDEWVDTAVKILKPWADGTLAPSALTAAHNGHRILLGRLWEVLWFEINSRTWDPLLVCTANALLHAATAALLALALARGTSPRRQAATAALALGVFAIPFGYANLLVGFQSPFFFMTACTAITVGALAGPASWGRTALALGAMLAAVGTTGAGGSVPLAGLTMLAFRALRDRRCPPPSVAAFAGCIAILALAGLTRAASGEGASPGAIATAAVRYLAWPGTNLVALVAEWPETRRFLPGFIAAFPHPDRPWIQDGANLLNGNPSALVAIYGAVALLLHLPAIVRLASLRRVPLTDARLAWIGLGIALAANVAALAIARSGERLIAPRYQDLLALGLLLNGAAALDLHATRHPLRAPCAAAWAAVAGLAIALTAAGIFAVQLPRKGSEARAQLALVTAYLAAGDASRFENQPPNHVPWPGGGPELARTLDDPAVRKILAVKADGVARPPAARIAALARWLAPAWIALGAAAAALWWQSQRRAASAPAADGE